NPWKFTPQHYMNPPAHGRSHHALPNGSNRSAWSIGRTGQGLNEGATLCTASRATAAASLAELCNNRPRSTMSRIEMAGYPQSMKCKLVGIAWLSRRWLRPLAPDRPLPPRGWFRAAQLATQDIPDAMRYLLPGLHRAPRHPTPPCKKSSGVSMKSSLLSTPLLCLSLLALGACGKGKENGPPKMPPPEVGVITAQPQNSPLTRDLVGRLSAFRSADVRARVAGVLLKRDYDEGTNVKRGQLLFQIDPAPLKAALNAAQASLAQAQATYTNNKVTAQRVRELAPKGYVSKADLDNALAAERSSAAAAQAARANVETARINLGYASVTSPIDGRAGQQQVTEGALVGNGEATLL